MAALSQVSLVSGLGSSCSQPLFENEPSKIVGSASKAISKSGEEEMPVDPLAGAFSRSCDPSRRRSELPSKAESAIAPSCSDVSHQSSNSSASRSEDRSRQYERTTSRPSFSPPLNKAMSSC